MPELPPLPDSIRASLPAEAQAYILVFAILPGLEAGSLQTTLVRAALFGLIAYATYDLTNLATLKDWPLLVTVVDLIWGTVLSVVVSYAGYLAGTWLS